MTVNESWEKIESWLGRYAPEDELPGPATQGELDRLQERIGLQLPSDVRESLLRHNGSGLVEVIPIGYTLYDVGSIAEAYVGADGARSQQGAKPHGVAIGCLGRTQLIVDTVTGQIGKCDVEFSATGYIGSDDPLWASLGSVLEFTANVLDSPPPWIATLPGDEEWEATNESPDFPGTLVWTEEV
ncbi:SMI1/KNR4 family protein [Streptomyces monticola]|uniref:SMI1/KNR4 family protein n=1 Tax=Streptomyces monticola TaxID=2666263 RepID=A0ABW2JFD4_9ACTN